MTSQNPSRLWHARRLMDALKPRRLMDALEPRRLMAVSGSVSANVTHQTIEALGAASTAFNFGSELATASYYNTLVGDLGASGVRAAVSPNFELANDNNDPNVFNWSAFDTAELAHVMNFNQRLEERGVDKFFVSIWTPPYWMKTNRAVTGGGSLRPDMYAEFAEYVAAVVISAERDYGITLDAVGLQNEQVFVEPYVSSQYDPIMLRNAVLAVQRKFEAENLPTRILVNEDVVLDFSVDRWKAYNNTTLEHPEIDRSRIVLGAHGSTIYHPNAMTQQGIYMADTGLPLWYTENSGENGDWTGGLRSARSVTDTLTKANATSYYYWLYSNVSWAGPTASLMNDGVPNAKYHALKHYYKYIRPGMQRMQSTVDETAETRLAAFKGANGTSTFVLFNNTAASEAFNINLNGGNFGSLRGYRSTDGNYFQSIGNVSANGSINVTLPAYSIVTLTSVADTVVTGGVGSTQVPIDTHVDGVYDNTTRRNINNYYWWSAASVDTLLAEMDAPGFDPNAAGIGGWTMLHAAAARSYFSADRVIEKLIAKGANVNATTTDGLTPLHVLAGNQLMDYSTANGFGSTPNMKVDALSLLLTAGADINARDAGGRTPLIWSAMTPIEVSPFTADTRMTQQLLANGADKTLTDFSGKTAYDWAMQEYKPQILSMLNGAGLDTQSPQVQYTGMNQQTRTFSIVITEDVTATLTPSDVLVANATTFVPVAGYSVTRRFANGLTFVDVTFPATLADGRYRVVLTPGSYADQNGLATVVGVNTTFTYLRGDADGNGTVNFSDLLIVAQNFNGQDKTYSEGDFNGDGTVNFDDLLLLAQRYGTSV
jgi:O-glycosyl hydrolase